MADTARRLSPIEREALNILRRHGRLVRRSGGFWTFFGVRLRDGVPVWWVGGETVRGLVGRGLVRLEGDAACVLEEGSNGGEVDGSE